MNNAPVITDAILADVDTVALESLSSHPWCAKFANWRRCLADQLRFAKRLGLDTWSPKLRILDIGCGFGYFVRIARYYGHDAVGLDMDREPLPEAAKILDAPVIRHTIREFERLPETLRRFDLITLFGFSVECRDHRPWTWREFAFLIRDCVGRLDRGGRFVAVFNRGGMDSVMHSATFCRNVFPNGQHEYEWVQDGNQLEIRKWSH